MNRDQAAELVKGNLEDYLRQKGLPTTGGRKFLCLNPAHPDKHPSMSYDRRRNKVHCFSCGADYSIIDLIGIDYGLTETRDIFDKAYSLYGITVEEPTPAAHAGAGGQKEDSMGRNQEAKPEPTPPQPDLVSYFRACQQRLQETDYHTQRGISQETAARFMLGFDPSFEAMDGETNRKTTWAALIVPTSRSSFAARNTDKEASKKNRWRKSQGTVSFFNERALRESTKPVYVVEGELDALSIIEVGGEAVALGSAANWRKLVRLLEVQKTEQPLLIALDNDDEGKRAEGDLAAALEEKKILFYRHDPCCGHKDANEALVSDRGSFAAAVEDGERIEEAAKEAEREAYLKNSAAAHLQDFLNGIHDNAATPCIPTGFASLDRALDDGLYEGLYIIGAISSLGKTTFSLQVADNIAQAGNHVLIFSLEMARSELMAKSISRHTLLDVIARDGSLSAAKTARGITTGKRYTMYSQEELATIQRAVREYSSYADNIFIYEGIGDIGVKQIREIVKRHISFTGRTPVIVIDYIQILAPADIRATDKQNTDKAVLELKRLSRDFKTPVIGISSFNRANYSEAVKMEAFKESGSLEYGSDVLLGLQLAGAGKKDFDTTKAKQQNPRQIELVILKNRNGRTGDTIDLEYYPLFNYFTEPK